VPIFSCIMLNANKSQVQLADAARQHLALDCGLLLRQCCICGEGGHTRGRVLSDKVAVACRRPVVVAADLHCFEQLLLSTAGIYDHIPDSYLDAVQELLFAEVEAQQKLERAQQKRW
jgi:hypothetical protein